MHLPTNTMKRKAAVVAVLLLLLLFVLAWAPWLDDRAIHDRILRERGAIDGTIVRNTGELICDYNVMWVPFGRWTASCEGGYFISFLG
ncbi:MAG: hypothetical protein V1813_01965 [Candidatus Aenigmatarchaeota archaeon]